jgi:hypothetical protein
LEENKVEQLAKHRAIEARGLGEDSRKRPRESLRDLTSQAGTWDMGQVHVTQRGGLCFGRTASSPEDPFLCCREVGVTSTTYSLLPFCAHH